MVRELRSGFRLFRSAPAFVLTAMITLAVGIGANTAMFSVVDRVLLHTVPYSRPERVLTVWNRAPSIGYAQLSFSPGDYLDYRERNHVFEDLGAGRQLSANLTGIGDPQRLSVARVTASVFHVLQLQPLVGRIFTETEDHSQAVSVAVLSSRLARLLFTSDAGAIGHTITIDDTIYNIIGVMPESFQFPSSECDVWLPLALGKSAPHVGHNYTVIGRLKPQATLAQAQSDVASMALALAKEFPKTNGVLSAYVETLQESMVGKIRPALLILLSAVGLVLFMACANVANLLLARASVRQTESAVRMALGASRSAIVRQFMLEGLPVSLAGGALGLVFALGCLRLLLTLVPATVPGHADVAINTDVLGFTLLVSLLTAFLFALAPALQASKADIAEELHVAAWATADPRRLQLRNLLIISEITLAATLLICSGLLIKSFARLTETDPGFKTENVITMTLTASQNKYKTPVQLAGFYQELLTRVQPLPGVQDAGLVNRLPLSGEESSGPITIETVAGDPKQLADIGWRAASPRYFRAMGIPLLQGRDFLESDAADRPGVVIIDDLTAQSFWPREDPIGKRLKLGAPEWNVPWLTVVGMVGHVRHKSLDSEAKMMLYWPFEQRPENKMTLVVRVNGNPQNVAAAVRGEMRALDKDQPVSSILTLDEVLSDSLAQRHFMMLLLAIFAAIALTLAVVGIYGVMAYTVSKRTREIGIRMSLGAGRLDVLALILRDVVKLTAVGVVFGLACTAATSRLLQGFLFGVSPTDPLVWSFGILLLIGVALLGGLIPAIRAALTPPVEALRSE